MSRLCHGIVWASLFASAGPARGYQPQQAQAAPAGVTAVFHDGSVLCQVSLPPSVELSTKYGKLTVPMKDVRKIEFGLRLPAETQRQIDEAIRDLGSKRFNQREQAVKRLVALGHRAYGAVQEAARSGDKEVARRAVEAAQLIQAKTPPALLQLKPHDVIVTGDCVLAGRLVGDTLKARTGTFGEMQLKLSDLRSLHGPGDAIPAPAVAPPPVATTSSATPTLPPLVLPAPAAPGNLPVPVGAGPGVPVMPAFPAPAPAAPAPAGIRFGFVY
jgi:hypothetical protein